MEDNWIALGIAILAPKYITPEQAFAMLNKVPKPKKHKVNKQINNKDILDMIELKKTHTYQEIGLMYGMTYTAIYRRIKRYKEKIQNRRIGI